MEDTTNLAEAKDNESTRELQANLNRYKVEHNHEVTKVAKVNKTEGEAEGTGVLEVMASEVTASDVTAPTEETRVDPMTKDDLKEEEEVNGEQGVQMDTSKGTTEMTLIWVTTVGMPVLYL